MTAPPATATTDLRTRLAACIEHLGHVLPGQASIRDFVHHNTLHGFQHLPFPEAMAAAGRLTGARVWIDEASYRRFHAEGRIDDSDLDAAMTRVARDAGVNLDEPLVVIAERTLTRREVLRKSLLHPVAPIPLANFKWQVEEMGALTGATALWTACLDTLGIDDAFSHPEELFELARLEEKRQIADIEGQESFAERAAALWDELHAQVGHDMTLGELLRHLTGEDALDRVRPALIHHLSAHLDQGLAPWRNPAHGQGFYAAWRASAGLDPTWTLEGLDDARTLIAALPEDPLDAIEQELTRLGLPTERWERYLERLALELPGWSGMFLWRHLRPGYAGTHDTPVDMLDYLAVRLVLERIAGSDIARRHWGVAATLPGLGAHFRRHPAELWVRQAFHTDELPEFLLDLIEPHLPPAGDTALPQPPGLWEWLVERIEAWRDTPGAECTARHGLTRSAWPLFQLARALGLTAVTLSSLGRTGAETLLGALRRFDANQRGYLWLLAYERHYREQILTGLTANHGRWRGHAGLPTAQVVFCMDDREEGMRRHLEEIAPQTETLGGAAHFAVFQNHYALGETRPTALCPVIPEVIVPAHDVHEVPRTDTGAMSHRQNMARRTRWRIVPPPFLGGMLARLAARRDTPVATRLAHVAADDTPATPEAPRTGFTDAEGAERIDNYLTALGLTRSFAPLIVIMGHGSNSTNNPHMAAYDCGACAGRHSGPNARLFAALANRPGVRSLLAARGILVPESSWFVGAEHNTCDDGILWYDTEDIPTPLMPTLTRLKTDLTHAARAHAQERCRRLFSAPSGIGMDAALAHVAGRRRDWSQARPELGHVTNACAFFGRRAMSRGAFFDRRSFLISYDPTQDPEGKVLERHLLINGAVGAGISLEYFFSTLNNDHFGCGSKITHNVAGHLGVMHGAGSDLATGLPRQMIEIHEAMRLLVVVEQTLDLITAIYQRQPPLQELVGNGWVIVAAKNPESGEIHLFDPQEGWLPWQPARPPATAIPTVARSVDWFFGRREPLSPALLEKPLEGMA